MAVTRSCPDRPPDPPLPCTPPDLPLPCTPPDPLLPCTPHRPHIYNCPPTLMKVDPFTGTISRTNDANHPYLQEDLTSSVMGIPVHS